MILLILGRAILIILARAAPPVLSIVVVDDIELIKWYGQIVVQGEHANRENFVSRRRPLFVFIEAKIARVRLPGGEDWKRAEQLELF